MVNTTKKANVQKLTNKITHNVLYYKRIQMSEEKDVLRVTIDKDGGMQVMYADIHPARKTQALFLAGLYLQDQFIASEQAKPSPIEVPSKIIDTLRK